MNVSPKLTFVFSSVLFKIAKLQSCHRFVVVLSNTIHSFIMSVCFFSSPLNLLFAYFIKWCECTKNTVLTLFQNIYHMVMMFCFQGVIAKSNTDPRPH